MLTRTEDTGLWELARTGAERPEVEEGPSGSNQKHESLRLIKRLILNADNETSFIVSVVPY
jgi:hypothetical protein